jgi:hypothetical protein
MVVRRLPRVSPTPTLWRLFRHRPPPPPPAGSSSSSESWPDARGGGGGGSSAANQISAAAAGRTRARSPRPHCSRSRQWRRGAAPTRLRPPDQRVREMSPPTAEPKAESTLAAPLLLRRRVLPGGATPTAATVRPIGDPAQEANCHPSPVCTKAKSAPLPRRRPPAWAAFCKLRRRLPMEPWNEEEPRPSEKLSSSSSSAPASTSRCDGGPCARLLSLFEGRALVAATPARLRRDATRRD